MAPDVASQIYVQLGLSDSPRFFRQIVWLTAGAACDKKGQILATPNAAMGVLDENHISALMHGSLIL